MSDLYTGGSVKLNPAAIEELLTGPAGPVMRDAAGRGEAVHALARSKVRPSRVRVGRPGSQAWSNSVGLRDSGSVEYARVPGIGAVVLVRFKKRYAYVVNSGSRPHIIRPKTKKALAFYWGRVGSDVVLREVHHPGYKGNRFLSGSIDAASAGGFSVALAHPATDITPHDLSGVA